MAKQADRSEGGGRKLRTNLVKNEEARCLISEPPSPFWRFSMTIQDALPKGTSILERITYMGIYDYYNTKSTDFDTDELEDDPITLTDLSEQKIWVAWKKQLNKQGKPTKIPKDPATGDNAKVPSDPNTYGTLDDAITCSKAMRGKGGVGVVLGRNR